MGWGRCFDKMVMVSLFRAVWHPSGQDAWMGLMLRLKVEETQLRALVGAVTTCSEELRVKGRAQEGGVREACAWTGSG